ncbi:MAG TPA: trigger factor, partial [Clostridia bacterium]|nr:trigger factor [Clostridia bacterium]
MEYSIQELSKAKIEIALSVSKEEWAQAVNKAYEKTKHQFAVEGFRKGKVPMNIIVKRYGIEIFYEDALDIALNEHYGKIIENDKLDVIGRPDVDIKEVSEDGMKAVITTAIRPCFTLGQYKGLSFIKPEINVTSEEIESVMKREQEARGRLVDKAEGAQVTTGDIITLDYSGSVDGVKFEGGTAEDQTLEIGSNTFIPGFESQLVGMKVGETKNIDVTFPTEYTPELAGKAAVFEVSVKAIKNKELPAIDDEFVKDISDKLNTVDEWRKEIETT